MTLMTSNLPAGSLYHIKNGRNITSFDADIFLVFCFKKRLCIIDSLNCH